MKKVYSLNCGTLTLRYSLLYPETRRYFGEYLKETSDFSSLGISITPEYMEESRWLVDDNEESKSFLEFQSLMLATGNKLLEYDRALFHGVALLWKDRAWIITAPSGIGKTTQLKLWTKLLYKDVKIINGDKPIVECKSDNSIWVYSSPWRGKEKFGKQGLCAQLGGIILLEQGLKNQINRMFIEEAVLPLFIEFVSYPENIEQLKHQGYILKQMLNAVPVWKLINTGDEDSAKLTVNTLNDYLRTKVK